MVVGWRTREDGRLHNLKTKQEKNEGKRSRKRE